MKRIDEELSYRNVCRTCKEATQDVDPGLSNGVCCYCGYWGVPPGPEREAHRAKRRSQR